MTWFGWALIVDLDEQEADLLLATLDPLAAMAERDTDALDALLDEVRAEDAAGAAMLEGLRSEPEASVSVRGGGGGDLDEIPEPPATPVAEIGDMWELGRHRILCCDWRSWAAVWESAKRAGMDAKNLLVWDKGGQGLGANYANTYELIGFFAKLPPQTAMGDRKTGQRPVHRPNLLRFDRVRGDERLHNAAKPVGLFQEFVENSTDPGDAVLDLFLGSGTTIMAAEVTDRVGLGMEIEPKWVDVAVKRWEAHTGQKATCRKL